MKNWKSGLVLVVGCVTLSLNAHSQILKKLGKQLEEKAGKVVDKAINRPSQSSSNQDQNQPTNRESNSGGPFKNSPLLPNEFKAGTQLVFADDFSVDAKGSMAKKWTSNGTGSVETVSGMPGSWLKLYDDNTYKIKELVHIPDRFTVEFDLLTYAETKNDFAVSFGFDYQKGVGAHYFLPYKNPINVNASYRFNRFEFSSNEAQPNKNSEVQANMSYFVNDVMKVKMLVDGTLMKVFVNDYKVLDTEMVDPKTKKYFYLAVDNDKNINSIYLGNFKMTKL
jgi:hypothetical protein